MAPERLGCVCVVARATVQIPPTHRAFGVLLLSFCVLHPRNFCDAKAGDVLNGVTLPPDKTATDGTVTHAMVDAYVSDYLMKRLCLSGKGKGKHVVLQESLQACVDGLVDLKVHQLAMEPHRFTNAQQRS